MKRTALALAALFTLLAPSLLAPSLLAQTPATTPTKPWTVEEVYKDGGPSARPPNDPVWSPDGRRITFVASDNQIGQPVNFSNSPASAHGPQKRESDVPGDRLESAVSRSNN